MNCNSQFNFIKKELSNLTNIENKKLTNEELINILKYNISITNKKNKLIKKLKKLEKYINQQNITNELKKNIKNLEEFTKNLTEEKEKFLEKKFTDYYRLISKKIQEVKIEEEEIKSVTYIKIEEE